MLRNEMNEQLAKVEKSFHRSYEEPILEIFYEHFKTTHVRFFREIVVEVLSSNRQFPTLHDFKRVENDLKLVKYKMAKERQTAEVKENWGDKAADSLKVLPREHVIAAIKDMRSKVRDYSNEWKKNHEQGTYINNTTLWRRNVSN